MVNATNEHHTATLVNAKETRAKYPRNGHTTGFSFRFLRRAAASAVHLIIPILTVTSSVTFVPTVPVAAQVPVRTIPVALMASKAKTELFVVLEHGMPRRRVLDLMGPPSLESVIGTLGRTRAIYDDETELLFEDERLIAIKSPLPPKVEADGRLAIQRDGMIILYSSDLALPDHDPLPHGDERHLIDDGFYFKESVPADDRYDIHFTPSTPQCLLDDCPGCEACGESGESGRVGGSMLGGESCYGGIDSDVVCSEPAWNLLFSLDALFLARDSDDFALSLLDGANVAQTADLSHGLTPGVRASLGLNLTGETMAELVYLGSHEWSASGSSSNLIPASSGVISSAESYGAELSDVQINLIHHRFGREWSLLWGVRYSKQEDDFTVLLDGEIAGPPAVPRNPLDLRGSAKNQLIGVQVGADHHWRCGPVLLFGRIKGGVLHNETEQFGPSFTDSIDLSGNPASVPTFTSDGEQVSFVGDFEFSLKYAFGRLSSIRLGYQGLIFSDIAQVIDQQGQAADPETLSYNGVFAGLEIYR